MKYPKPPTQTIQSVTGRFSPLLAGLVCLLIFSGSNPNAVVNAQLTSSSISSPASASATVVKPLTTMTPTTRRDAMYKKLAEEEVALTRQFSLLKKLVKTVGPSVAHIEAKKRQKSSATSRSSSKTRRSVVVEEAGSGVVIQYRGAMYVITNYHVIESSEAQDITVEVGGKVYRPRRLIHDRETDISVIGLTETDLVPSRLGNSSGVEIGDFVVAVGSPFGLSHSVSYGIISAMDRHDLDLGPQGVRYQNFMQTDAAINPGNSGGPLINLRGEIIGINTAIASNSGGNDGIGFSIPINMAMRIVTDLIDFGKVQRGFLGVSLDATYSFEKASQLGLNVNYGALVSAITASSPAAESDLRVGDVILEYNNQRVDNDSQLVTHVSLTRLNTRVPVKIYRRGEFKNVSVRIRNRNQFEK